MKRGTASVGGKGDDFVTSHDALRVPRGRMSALIIAYGFTCGLIFPLMISSTYLKELSLSHGAGDSFGLLFFVFYALTMLTSPLWRAAWRPVMTVALASAFLGNSLMLLRELELIAGGLPYAVVVSASIGFGLATAELGWLDRLRGEARARSGAGPTNARPSGTLGGEADHAGWLRLPVAISLVFLVGGTMAAFIFVAPGVIELPFALLALAASIAIVWRSAAGAPEGGARAPGIDRKDVPHLIKAVSYLVVFAFIFGAVSQMSVIDRQSTPLTEVQALLGIGLAALLSCLVARRREGAGLVAGAYGALVPVVAVCLVALPFIGSSLVGVIATVLVFVAFYLTGINVRAVICRIVPRGSSVRTIGGVILGIEALSVLAGVALGAFTLSGGETFERLAFVSLVSMLVLVLSPLAAQTLVGRTGSDARADVADMTDGDGARGSWGAGDRGAGTDLGGEGALEREAVTLDERRVRSYAEQRGLTAREADVLWLICQGRSRPYIAQELGISPNTVKGYAHSVYQKCAVDNKQDLLDQVHAHLT